MIPKYFETDDLVIKNEQFFFSYLWKIRQVIEIHHGSDGYVRTVNVITSTGQ